jgi:hypothetical protein
MAGQVKEGMNTLNLLDRITTEPQATGDFLCVYGPPGVGKTTTFTRGPKTLTVQVRDKSLDTLIKHKQIAALPKLNVENWEELNQTIDALKTQEHDYRVAVIDGASGAEEFCDEYIIRTECDNDRDKFLAFGRGDRMAGMEWGVFLEKVVALKEERGVTVILLAHQSTQSIKNPNGTDYIQSVPSLNKSKFAPTNKYADAILMMDFLVAVGDVQTQKDKSGSVVKTIGKAKGNGARVLHCDGSAGFIAKNRLGLPAVLPLGNSHDEAWAAFVTALKAGKS